MKQVRHPLETEVLWVFFCVCLFFLMYSLEKASKILHSSIPKSSAITLRLKLRFLNFSLFFYIFFFTAEQLLTAVS